MQTSQKSMWNKIYNICNEIVEEFSYVLWKAEEINT